MQLIPRLYDVPRGEVLVDGVNVKEYSLKHLREGVGMVLQKNILFSGTIEENLRWGNEDAPMEDVIRFSESAQADPFVMNFKNGFDTEMGQGGVNVSGGQMQRVAIARAIVNNPRLLLADEPTGALDSKSGRQVMELFQKLNDEGVSVLMITHDPDIAAHAKRVVMIRDGELQEKR